MTNVASNAYWEVNLPADFEKPPGFASDYEVREFISKKYVLRRFVDPYAEDPVTAFQNRANGKNPSESKKVIKRSNTTRN